MFVYTHERNYLPTMVAFLLMQVTDLYENTWGKLKCLLWYTNSTLYLPFILRDYISSLIKWYAYDSFFVQHDKKDSTDGAFTLGEGTVTG